MAAAFVLDLLSSDALGTGFDSALFQILLNSAVIDSQSFTDLASAEAFFSNHLIGVPLLAGFNSVQLAFSETMSGTEGFSFDYAVASSGHQRGPRPHRRCWPARPDLGERWPSRLVATATANRLITCEHLLRIAGRGLSAPHAATLAPAFASKGRAASSES